MTLVRVSLLALLLVALWPRPAAAIPRFAARNGSTCLLCHVNPTGGGVRNAYGRNVFEKAWLPMSGAPRQRDWVVTPGAEPAATASERRGFGFDPEISAWLTLGGDLRAAYIYIQPDRGATPGAEAQPTSSFFLMQADLYHAATLNDHVTMVLDVGVYSGFEAYALFSVNPASEPDNVIVKVGRFVPAFGIREVEHQLFTRDGIGLGATDRDTGVELTVVTGSLTAQLGLFNGTLGDTSFDTHGSERAWFEKAVAARVSVRGGLGALRAELGGSFYYSADAAEPNPLLARSIPSDHLGAAGQGVYELRTGGFLMANLGRLTYLADLAIIRDAFAADHLTTLVGYASYQELSFVPAQGLELIATLEYADPDVDILGNGRMRAGLVTEIFPWPFTELRAMVRRTWDDKSATGGSWDLVLFAHLFF